MTAGRRAAGALSPRGSVGGSGASKMRRALRGILFTLLRRRSGLRVKKRTRVGGRQSVRVITVPSASAAPETRAAADDRDHDDDDDDDDDSVSGAESDSSDVVFVDETPARASPRGGSLARAGPDVVRATADALGLRPKSERGMGNCMFCAVSSGINTWLASARGSAGKAADKALVSDATRKRKKKPSLVTWAHLRAALARHLRAIARDAPKVAGVRDERGPFASPHEEVVIKKRVRRAKELVMCTLMEGRQGRAWLTRGALRFSSVAERFDKYVESMATDASPFAGHETWRRYWGADNELVVLASKLRVAMVCVEAATGKGGVFLAVPADVAVAREDVTGKKNENENENENALARFGRYVCDGAFETYDRSSSFGGDASNCLRWRVSRGAVTLTVRLARADSKAARRAVAGDGFGRRLLPALAVVHRPGHFDSLQPEEGYVLVMEREEKARPRRER